MVRFLTPFSVGVHGAIVRPVAEQSLNEGDLVHCTFGFLRLGLQDDPLAVGKRDADARAVVFTPTG